MLFGENNTVWKHGQALEDVLSGLQKDQWRKILKLERQLEKAHILLRRIYDVVELQHLKRDSK
jgi:hypothetical protein